MPIRRDAWRLASRAASSTGATRGRTFPKSWGNRTRVTDHLADWERFRYKIALPAPALYGQFNNLDDAEVVLAGLLEMGFDEVYEVAAAAELVSDATRLLLSQGGLERPVIRSGSPAAPAPPG